MAKDLRSLIRLHTWHVDQRRRALGALLRQVAELETRARNLEAEVIAEQQAAAADPTVAGFLYGNYAAAVIERRTAIAEATAEAEQAVDKAREALRQTHRELKKFEITKAERDRQAREEEDHKEQLVLDELGIQSHRRRLL